MKIKKINLKKLQSLKSWAKKHKKAVVLSATGATLGIVAFTTGLFSSKTNDENKNAKGEYITYASEDVKTTPTPVPTQVVFDEDDNPVVTQTVSIEDSNIVTEEPKEDVLASAGDDKEETEEEKEEVEVVPEVTPEITPELTLDEIIALRKAQQVSAEEYAQVYYSLLSKYTLADNVVLSEPSVASVVYYMNSGSLSEEALETVAGNLITNDAEAVIDDTAIACEDIINYNLNVYLSKLYAPSEETAKLTPISLADAVVKEDQKEAVAYMESLVEKICLGETEEERMAALKEFHSIIIYGDADVENETTTEKYDGVKFNELTPEQQFLMKQILVVETNVLAGTAGLDFTTYYNDKKSSAIGDFNRLLDPELGTNFNPLKKDGCPQLIIK